jgi:hypothetical protein
VTQITLPNTSVTGANLWSQVEDNDKAIRDVVNGDLDDGNIATGADIDGAKLLAASVDTTQLAADAVTGAKIEDDAVDTEHLADDAVENAQIADDAVGTAQIADGAVTGDKIAASTTGSVTFSNSASDGSPGVVARKYANGQVMLEGSFLRVGASKATIYATLPAGYRPSATRYFAIKIGDTEILGTAEVDTGGNITLDWSGTPSPAPYTFFLDGITFHAA